MKFFIILFGIFALIFHQYECVEQVGKKLGYPQYKSVRYCNGGQM